MATSQQRKQGEWAFQSDQQIFLFADEANQIAHGTYFAVPLSFQLAINELKSNIFPKSAIFDELLFISVFSS